MLYTQADRFTVFMLVAPWLTVSVWLYGMGDGAPDDRKQRKTQLHQFFDYLIAPVIEPDDHDDQSAPEASSFLCPLHKDDRDKLELVSRLITAVGVRLKVNALFLDKKQKAQDLLAVDKTDNKKLVDAWNLRREQLATWHQEKPEVNAADLYRLSLVDSELGNSAAIRQLLQLDAMRFPENQESNDQAIGVLASALGKIDVVLKRDVGLQKAQRATRDTQVETEQPKKSASARRLSVVDEKD